MYGQYSHASCWSLFVCLFAGAPAAAEGLVDDRLGECVSEDRDEQMKSTLCSSWSVGQRRNLSFCSDLHACGPLRRQVEQKQRAPCPVLCGTTAVRCFTFPGAEEGQADVHLLSNSEVAASGVGTFPFPRTGSALPSPWLLPFFSLSLSLFPLQSNNNNRGKSTYIGQVRWPIAASSLVSLSPSLLLPSLAAISCSFLFIHTSLAALTLRVSLSLLVRRHRLSLQLQHRQLQPSTLVAIPIIISRAARLANPPSVP